MACVLKTNNCLYRRISVNSSNLYDHYVVSNMNCLMLPIVVITVILQGLLGYVNSNPCIFFQCPAITKKGFRI